MDTTSDVAADLSLDQQVQQEETSPITSVEEREAPKMSKNQMKKLRRELRRQETKAQWRKLQKDKRKLREQAKRQEYIEKGLEPPVRKRIRTDPTKVKESTVVFDLSFDGIMVNREASSLCSQIMRCYSANRRAEKPFNLEVCGLAGGVGERFTTMYPEHIKWDMTFSQEHFLASHPDKESIVYLTPDTDTVLESIDADKVYIIGGIVDKNRFKGKTNQTAQELGIKTARLPVPEYIDLKTSPVLTIFHVLEILLKFKECGDWKQSLEAFVPKRNIKYCGGLEDNGESTNEDEERTSEASEESNEVNDSSSANDNQ